MGHWQEAQSGAEQRDAPVACSQVAGELNDAGWDMKKVLKPEVEIPWNLDLAKEFLWRPIQAAMFQKESTTEPTTSEYVQVYEVLNRHLANKFGVSVPWPTGREQ
jgi:hypothetical protein